MENRILVIENYKTISRSNKTTKGNIRKAFHIDLRAFFYEPESTSLKQTHPTPSGILGTIDKEIDIPCTQLNFFTIYVKGQYPNIKDKRSDIDIIKDIAFMIINTDLLPTKTGKYDYRYNDPIWGVYYIRINKVKRFINEIRYTI